MSEADLEAGELPDELWWELRRTDEGGTLKKDWSAALRTMAPFRRVAKEVAEGMGPDYPDELDQGVMRFAARLRRERLPTDGRQP